MSCNLFLTEYRVYTNNVISIVHTKRINSLIVPPRKRQGTRSSRATSDSMYLKALRKTIINNNSEIINVDWETYKCHNTYHFEFCLYFPEFSSRENLYMRRYLFSRSRLTGPQFDITGDQLVATCNITNYVSEILVYYYISLLK